MSNIRLKTITIETSNDLTIKNGNTVFLNTTENSILTNGGVRIANTQDATALTTGALSISGGLSILKNTLMDGNLNLTNTNAQFNIINKLNITNSLFEFSPNGVDNLITMTDNKMSILSTNPSSNLSSGALIISGGLTILTTDNSAITTNGGALTIMGGSYFNGKLRCQDQVSLTATVNTVGNITINNTNTGINVASPNFALDVNGIVNTNGRFITRVSAGGFNPNFTAYPLIDGQESSIAFYNNTAGSVASQGNVWIMGHNVWGSGNRTFGIGTPHAGSILTMNTSGQTQFNNNVNIVRSNTTPSLVISGGITSGNGANIVLKGGGLVGSSVNIDLSTYDHTTNAPTSRIQAVDENFSSNLILMTKIPGSATNALQSRMYIRNDGNIGINTTTPTHLLHINGTVLATGQTVISNTTNSVSATTGSLIVSGGVGINNNLYVGNDVNILGSLTVNGNTSFVNTTNIEIKDNLILLNSAPLGTSDSGMFIQRFQSSNDSNLGDVVNDTTFSSQTLPSQSALTNTEIRLDPSSSSVDNFYNGWWIKVVSGFSSNQVRQIISYNGTSKIATINSNWTTQNPSQTDIINLYNKPFAGIIYNELSDTFEFISSNIRPTSSSLNITDYLPVKLSKLNINDTSFNSVISNGGFVSLNTQNSLNLTSGGCLTLYGGSSISKDLLLGGSLIFPNKNNVVLNPNSDDRLSTQQFTAANNQTLQPITNLSFTSDTWGFDVYLSARVQSSVNQFCNYHIRGVNKVSSWTISYTSTGDNMGLVFDISTSGNLLYSSPNYSSFSSLIFKFKAITN